MLWECASTCACSSCSDSGSSSGSSRWWRGPTYMQLHKLWGQRCDVTSFVEQSAWQNITDWGQRVQSGYHTGNVMGRMSRRIIRAIKTAFILQLWNMYTQHPLVKEVIRCSNQMYPFQLRVKKDQHSNTSMCHKSPKLYWNYQRNTKKSQIWRRHLCIVLQKYLQKLAC